MKPLKTRILETIERLQNDPKTAATYNSEITGHGVTVWALSGEFGETEPKELVAELKSLAAEGRIKVIEPDKQGLMSFIIAKTKNKG